jgi:hypothetical protein
VNHTGSADDADGARRTVRPTLPVKKPDSVGGDRPGPSWQGQSSSDMGPSALATGEHARQDCG